ncbi:MAG: DnaJ domain-containing protein [Nodosilinea sp.]
MALAHYYRILGLRTGASFGDVKLAYRNLARLYHPDLNPTDQQAKEKFIHVTQAYQTLADALLVEDIATTERATEVARPARPTPVTANPVQPQAATQGTADKPADPKPAAASVADDDRPAAKVEAKTPAKPPASEPDFAVRQTPGGSDVDQELKVSSFKQLRDLFRSQRFPMAVALVEGLAHRFPNDPEVRQWYAITYYRWGHDLLNAGNAKKAEACLKKAHRTDPHNKSLRQALQHDFQRLEQLSRIPVAH